MNVSRNISGSCTAMPAGTYTSHRRVSTLTRRQPKPATTMLATAAGTAAAGRSVCRTTAARATATNHTSALGRITATGGRNRCRRSWPYAAACTCRAPNSARSETSNVTATSNAATSRTKPEALSAKSAIHHTCATTIGDSHRTAASESGCSTINPKATAAQASQSNATAAR